MSEAKEVRFTEGDVIWCGQTIQDGGAGRVLFGMDSKGALHIEIVCDRTPDGGTVQVNRCECPGGAEMIKWLDEWFSPRPLPGMTIL